MDMKCCQKRPGAVRHLLRRRFCHVLILMVAITLLGGAFVLSQPQGSDASSAEKTDPRAFVPPDAVKGIVMCGAQFQMQASVDFEKALKNFRAESVFEFVTKHPAYEHTPLAWEYFFSSAIAITGNYNGPVYTIGYYNPFLDAVVLTRWTIDSEFRPSVVAASVRTGATLGGVPEKEGPSLPRWLASGKPMPVALKAEYSDFTTTFSKNFPPDSQTEWTPYTATSPDVLKQLMADASLNMAQLYAYQNRVAPPVFDMLTEFRSALFDGDEESLARFLKDETGLTAAEAVEIPAQFREEIVGLYATASDDVVLLFMADPKVMQFASILTYKMTAPGKILSFNVFDMTSEEQQSGDKPAQKGIDL